MPRGSRHCSSDMNNGRGRCRPPPSTHTGPHSMRITIHVLMFLTALVADVLAELPDVRLNQIQVIGSHNSYHIAPAPPVMDALSRRSARMAESLDYTHRPLQEQFTHLGIRQIELDLFADPDGGPLRRAQSIKNNSRSSAGLVTPSYEVTRDEGPAHSGCRLPDDRPDTNSCVEGSTCLVKGQSNELSDHGNARAERVQNPRANSACSVRPQGTRFSRQRNPFRVFTRRDRTSSRRSRRSRNTA